MKIINNYWKSSGRFAVWIFAAVALTAVAQYETDTLPPGVVPRSNTPLESFPGGRPNLAPQGNATPGPQSPPLAEPALPARLLLDAPPTTADEKARFLTGRRLSSGSRLAALQSTPWYLDHAKTYAASWRGFDGNYFSKMRAWSAAEIAPRIGTPATVYYLFGGPDFISAYALFPDATNYILGGLEPVGTMMPPEQLDEQRLASGLAGLRESTSVILQFSHFITKDMKEDLQKTDFNGVLPILLSFLSLGGAEVTTVQYFAIDRTGALLLATEGSAPPSGTLHGVKVDFRKSAMSPTQSVYYVQADASDGALKSNRALLTWMGQFAPGVTYLKAASYLLHENYFSTVRTFLLQQSRAVLQDDSGIPIRFFPPGVWNVTFFGDYSGTLDIFAKYFQNDLSEIYRSSQPILPLGFGTGYKWKVGESNLMLAVRANTLAPPNPSPATQQPSSFPEPVR